MKLEDLFVSSLGSVKKLKWFLQYDINLIHYLNAKWPQIMFLATTTIALVPKSKLRREVGEISIDRILVILQKERPDLFKLINTERGLVWLQREIKRFEDYFLR